jgi:putative ABC transport system substrate-binding protein
MLAGLATAALLVPFASFASGHELRRVIWALNLGTEESRKRNGDPRDRIRGFFKAHGLVDGRDVMILFMDLQGRNDAAAGEALADRILRERPDIIVMVAHYALRFLRSRTRDIPVVFYHLGGDPAKLGLVESLQRPGTNFTGTTVGYTEYLSRKWQYLKEIAPWVKRAGTLTEKELVEDAKGDPMWGALYVEYKRMERATEERLGMEIVDVLVPRGASMDEMVAIIRASGVQGLMLDPYLPLPRQFPDYLKTSRIPAIANSFGQVKAGILMGTGWNWSEGEDYAVTVVHRILQGESVATIPVYQIRGYLLAINRATARAMGIEVPPSLLVQANELYD